MKPIETFYKGCKFRSRLEARWAVFFDSLKIIWEYEKEGFVMTTGETYLPDFWLPQLDCFFEVKGAEPTDIERKKAFRLSAEACKLVVMASGTMSTEELIVKDRSFGEWPKAGFTISAFGGEAHHMWPARAYDFYLWNWMLEIDLPPFIREEFPDEMIGHGDTEDRRKILVELDRKYYSKKYQKAHPRYEWGRYEKSLSWSKGTSGYQFSLEPDREGPDISAAYIAARSARFESF